MKDWTYRWNSDGTFEFVGLSPVDLLDLNHDISEILTFEDEKKDDEEPKKPCTCDMETILRKGCQCGGS